MDDAHLHAARCVPGDGKGTHIVEHAGRRVRRAKRHLPPTACREKRGEKAPRWADSFFNIDGQTCISRASYPDNRKPRIPHAPAIGGAGSLAGGSSTASRMAVVSAAPMNRNVKLVLIYVTCLSMYSSLTSGTPMTAYALLLRPDDYTAIGVMSGIQGTISLVMALPAGAISDCFGRQGMLRIAGVVALVSAAYMGAILLTLGTELENYLDQHQEHVVTASMPSKLTVGSDGGGAGVEASRTGFDGSLYSGSSSSSSIGGAGTDAGDASGLAAAGAAFATGRWRWGGAADLRGNWADEASSGDQPGSGEDAEATRIANELFYSLLGSSALWGIFMGLHSAPLEALFADSTVSGQRSKLFVWRSSLRTLGNVLGPLLSIIIFSQVDHPSWPLITLDCL